MQEQIEKALQALAWPSADRDRLRTGLNSYLNLLIKWNKTYNLTAVRDPQDMLRLHVLDCLAALAPVEQALQGPPAQLIDVGSGGGLPGIVMALAWPNAQLHLVDTVGKKVAFLRQCKADLKLANLQAHHARIEGLQISQQLGQASGAAHFTCRAFASLHDFVAQTLHLSQPQSLWFAMKGKTPDEELHELEQKLGTSASRSASSSRPEKVKVRSIQPLHPPGFSQEEQRCLVIVERCS